jgi:hypothetical protein
MTTARQTIHTYNCQPPHKTTLDIVCSTLSKKGVPRFYITGFETPLHPGYVCGSAFILTSTTKAKLPIKLPLYATDKFPVSYVAPFLLQTPTANATNSSTHSFVNTRCSFSQEYTISQQYHQLLDSHVPLRIYRQVFSSAQFDPSLTQISLSTQSTFQPKQTPDAFFVDYSFITRQQFIEQFKTHEFEKHCGFNDDLHQQLAYYSHIPELAIVERSVQNSKYSLRKIA